MRITALIASGATGICLKRARVTQEREAAILRTHAVDELFVFKAARRLQVESNYVYVFCSPERHRLCVLRCASLQVAKRCTAAARAICTVTKCRAVIALI
jgi:hypothetical protein